jgi:excisionase family DNA binding protein
MRSRIGEKSENVNASEMVDFGDEPMQTARQIDSGGDGRNADRPRQPPVTALTLDIAEELVERIAERAAELVAERQDARVEEKFVDVTGAAEFLACPRSRIYALVSAGRLPHHRDGSRLLFDRDELREYVHNGGARRP